MPAVPSAYNYGSFSVSPYEDWYRRFMNRLRVGTFAPDFSCIDTESNRVRLSDFRNKTIVVLEFGCMTCAPAVTRIARFRKSLSSIAPKFAPQGVEFLTVYTRETHPGEKVGRHRTYGEKVAHARRFKEEDGVKVRVLVDGLDGRIHRRYGILPNMVYIVNRDGRIAYKATWTDVEEVESVLANLLLWEREGFTPLDSVALVEKYHFIHDREVGEHRRVYERAGPKAVEDLRREVNLPI